LALIFRIPCIMVRIVAFRSDRFMQKEELT
jgi:hypothetical protein